MDTKQAFSSVAIGERFKYNGVIYTKIAADMVQANDATAPRPWIMHALIVSRSLSASTINKNQPSVELVMLRKAVQQLIDSQKTIASLVALFGNGADNPLHVEYVRGRIHVLAHSIDGTVDITQDHVNEMQRICALMRG